MAFPEYISDVNFNKSESNSLKNVYLPSKQLKSIQELLAVTIFSFSLRKLTINFKEVQTCVPYFYF